MPAQLYPPYMQGHPKSRSRHNGTGHPVNSYDGAPQANSNGSLISKNSKANRIETGERSGGIGEICSVEVEEK
jgi:hypothetical protein